ncbi:MAG: hypothetical protein ACRDP2_05810 [Nocardioidaceae bacterium]
MTTPLEDRLRTELRDEVTGVELRSDFVSAAVEDVRVRRRRRQVGIASSFVVVVTLAGIGGIAIDAQTERDGNPPPADETTPPPSVSTESAPSLDFADIQTIQPREMVWENLPWRDTALPQVLPTDVAAAPTLSNDPIDHAVALVGGPGSTVGVVGDDGQLRRLDGVSLERTRDPAGYRSSPVKQGSLTPDGSVAAFPQPDALVVVDLADGSSQRLDLPGFNTRVVWSPDRQHILVGREGGPSSLVDITDGSVGDVPYNAYQTTFTDDGAALEFRETPQEVWTSELIRWDGTDKDSRLPLSIWWGGETPPDASDGRLVLAGSVDDIHPSEETTRGRNGWIVLDIDTGTPIAMLRAPGAWYGTWLFGQCAWLDDETVIVQGEPGLLAWTPSTGALERVSTGGSQETSLATAVLD